MKSRPDIVKIQRLCMEAILKKQDVDIFVRNVYNELRYPIIVFDETLTLITYAFSVRSIFRIGRNRRTRQRAAAKNNRYSA